MSYQILHGDSRELLKTLGDNSVDAIVCDPPYNLTSIQNRFGKAGAASAADGVYLRSSKGFMGKAWDSDVAFHPAVWIECLRVLKPGGHLVAFGGCRTYHRMVCAVEDAGFEVRDQLAWLFATGFPKSHNVSKSIDRRAGAEREVIGVSENSRDRDDDAISWDQGKPCLITVPSTEEAQQWDGFGSALKPAWETILVARKPLTLSQKLEEIGSNLFNLESKLWSLLPANVVDEITKSDPSVLEKLDSAPWGADEKSNTQDALFARMDMSQYVLAIHSSLSTVLSWKVFLADASKRLSMCITETESNGIIDQKIWESCLLVITPESIILAHNQGHWSNVHASNAERYLNALVSRWRTTQELSALEFAIALAATNSQDVTEYSPQLEPVLLARKPLEGTIVENVLKWGTGALNIDATRVQTDDDTSRTLTPAKGWKNSSVLNGSITDDWKKGRWPANVCHDGSPEVLAGFPVARSAGLYPSDSRGTGTGVTFGKMQQGSLYDDKGSAARFFFSAKATRSERNGSRHPTVKPIRLIEWLIKLITPPGGTVLDPFAGSGTTGQAAVLNGFNIIMIEMEAQYVQDISNRMAEPKVWSIDPDAPEPKRPKGFF